MNIMPKSQPKVLLISSADPTKGPGIVVADFYEAFRQQGVEVDVLTLNKCEAQPDFLYLQDSTKIFWKIRNKLRYCGQRIYGLYLSVLHHCLSHPKSGFYFFYYKEDMPPVPTSMVLAKIKKKYDLVYIIFWQDMLSFATVRAIYRKLNCCVFFGAVDYSHMSGGCHFTGDCERYKTGCGCCPAFDSNDPHDFTWYNVNYRKKVYEEVNPIVTGNLHMQNFYKNSFLLKNYHYEDTHMIIDTTQFKPSDRIGLYKHYSISESKTFKILFGCQSISDERKGIKYLIEAINSFLEHLTDAERSQVLVMAIGKNFDAVKQQLKDVDTRDFGFVSMSELPSIYALADVFLCPSVNDAGPMMVNQSLCCGTPVVGFEMGSCLDAVKGRGTGYCAPLRDSKAFAEGIEKIYRQTPEERDAMRNKCVEHAQKTYSYEAAVKRMIDGYNTYKNQKKI